MGNRLENLFGGASRSHWGSGLVFSYLLLISLARFAHVGYLCLMSSLCSSSSTYSSNGGQTYTILQTQIRTIACSPLFSFWKLLTMHSCILSLFVLIQHATISLIAPVSSPSIAAPIVTRQMQQNVTMLR